MNSTKATAWDALGLKFWTLGRRTAKPRSETVRWFTEELSAHTSCLVVGGTSVGLVRAVSRLGSAITVMDFSERICAELACEVPASIQIVQGDVLDPPSDLAGQFSHLFCDTLVNRFDHAEARRFADTAAILLEPAGVLRATAKVGLYEMDLRLLESSMAAGDEASFWEPASRTVDYRKLGDRLEENLVRHGQIARRDLLAWYRGRGREKRFDEAELSELFYGPRWRSVQIAPDGRAERVRLTAVRVGDFDGVDDDS